MLWANDLWAPDVWAPDVWVGLEAAGRDPDRIDHPFTLGTEGGIRPSRPVYVVNLNGTDYLVDSLAQANELVAANTPTVEPLPPEAPLPRFEVTIPEPRPEKVAMPRASTGIRKLV